MRKKSRRIPPQPAIRMSYHRSEKILEMHGYKHLRNFVAQKAAELGTAIWVATGYDDDSPADGVYIGYPDGKVQYIPLERLPEQWQQEALEPLCL